MDTYYFNEKRIDQKNIDELIGICQGVLADNLVNKDEVYFLYEWIEGKFFKETISKFFLVNYIYHDTEEILEKQDFSEKALDNFKNKLKNIISLDTILSKNIIVEDNSICCCSGIFAEDKKIIKQKLRDKNIIIKDNITLNVDYLIIGSFGNPEWKHGIYGNKIEKAIKYNKERNAGISIISEQELLKSL